MEGHYWVQKSVMVQLGGFGRLSVVWHMEFRGNCKAMGTWLGFSVFETMMLYIALVYHEMNLSF